MFLTLKVQGLVFQEPHLDGLSTVLMSTLKAFSIYIHIFRIMLEDLSLSFFLDQKNPVEWGLGMEGSTVLWGRKLPELEKQQETKWWCIAVGVP